MTVDELKDYLDQLPGDAQVFLSTDAEGNGFSRLHGFDIGYTEEDGARIEEFYGEDEIDQNEDDPGYYEQIVVLWPV